jgi:hypothetical protein
MRPILSTASFRTARLTRPDARATAEAPLLMEASKMERNQAPARTLVPKGSGPQFLPLHNRSGTRAIR